MKSKFKPHPKQDIRGDMKFRGPFVYEYDDITGKLEIIKEEFAAPTEFWCDWCEMWLDISRFGQLIINPERVIYQTIFNTNLFIPKKQVPPEDDLHLCITCWEVRYKAVVNYNKDKK